tara:strand:+ start:373 stop:516 length:144 start_codon:yes stop_codon:yes gene_type:complete
MIGVLLISGVVATGCGGGRMKMWKMWNAGSRLATSSSVEFNNTSEKE